MRRATFDRFPAEVTDGTGQHYSRVRVLVADDGTAWIIAQSGEVFVTDHNTNPIEVTHDGPTTSIVGPDWTVTTSAGCGCNGEASRLKARELLNQ